jgi:hypothetical protein
MPPMNICMFPSDGHVRAGANRRMEHHAVQQAERPRIDVPSVGPT